MDHPDSYRGFAEHYDLHGWDWYASTYGPRLFRLLEERGLAGARVLDAGCGTGSLALSLASRGHRVTGVDLSDPMLAVARRKDIGAAVTWRRADITRLELSDAGGPFDLVTCVADTLNHLESLEEWEKAFRGFAAHLQPGGALFIDVMTCRGLARLDRISVTEMDGQTLLLAIIYESAARRSTVKVTSFVRQPAGHLYERASETITEWGQPVAGILQRLESAGFSEAERLWKTADDAEGDERLAVIARKAEIGRPRSRAF